MNTDGWSTDAKDLHSLVIGDKIAYGSSRHVFESLLDKTTVIKVETRSGYFQNVLEWEVWTTVKGTKYEKWFAPCVAISSNGMILIQKKVEMIQKASYPKKIPSFLADRKYTNYGMLGKQLVCFDYGTIHIKAFEKAEYKMEKAGWWEE